MRLESGGKVTRHVLVTCATVAIARNDRRPVSGTYLQVS